MRRNIYIYAVLVVALTTTILIAKAPLSKWLYEVEWDFIGVLPIVLFIPSIVKASITKGKWRSEVKIKYKLMIITTVALYQLYLCLNFVSNDHYIFRFKYDTSIFIALTILFVLLGSVGLIFSTKLHHWIRLLYISLLTTLLLCVGNLLLLYHNGTFNESCNLYFIFVVFYGAIVQRYLLEIIDSDRKQRIALGIVGASITVIVAGFYMCYQVYNINDFSSTSTAKVLCSPCGKYTLYHVNTNNYNASYYITKANSPAPIIIASEHTITGILRFDGKREANWIYEGDKCIGFTYSAHHNNISWIELPPTLWDRLRTWIILQKYPELSNPEFLNSARESVEE